MRNFITKFLSLVLGLLFFSITTTTNAEVKTYIGAGSCISDNEIGNNLKSMSVAKEIAKLQATRDAQKQIINALNAISSVNDKLILKNEVIAFSAGMLQIQDVKYDTIPFKKNKKITLNKASVNVNVDYSLLNNKINEWLSCDIENRKLKIDRYIDLEEYTWKLIEYNEVFKKFVLESSDKESALIKKGFSNLSETMSLLDQYQKAHQEYENKNYATAVKILNEAIKQMPESPYPYNSRGNVYKELGNQIEAANNYTKAINLYPSYRIAYNNRGNIYNQLGEYNRAINDFQKSITLDSNDAEPYIGISIAYRNIQNYTQAMTNANKAISLNANFPSAYINLAAVYGDMKKYEEAIINLNQALQINPNLDSAYCNRGLAYGYLNKYEVAIPDFNKAIELNPRYADAYYGRGLAYANLKDFNKAILDFSKVIEIDSTYSNAYQGRAYCYEQLGDTNKQSADMAIFYALSLK